MLISRFEPTKQPASQFTRTEFRPSKEESVLANHDSVTLSGVDLSSPAAGGYVRRALDFATPIGLWTLPAVAGAIGGPGGALLAGLAGGVVGFVASSQSESNYNPGIDLWSGVAGAVIWGGTGSLGARFGLTAVVSIAAGATLLSLIDPFSGQQPVERVATHLI